MSEAAPFPPLILLDATVVATSIRRNLLLEGDEADMPRALLLTTRLGGVGAAVRGGLRGPVDDGSRTGTTTLRGESPPGRPARSSDSQFALLHRNVPGVLAGRMR
jgi:hypothetical protein